MRRPPVHVMVAILRDGRGRVLITRRPPGKPQAGRWEFPGGKLEDGEAAEPGLRRELVEELGVVAGPMQRLIEIRHDYPEFTVLLDVREIAHFGGTPRPREGQELKWVVPDKLLVEDILEADRPIIQAVRLPDRCLVTPDPAAFSRDQFLAGLDASLAAGVRLVQLRARTLDPEAYALLAAEVMPVCRHRDAQLILNGPAELLEKIDADGIHLDGARLRACAGGRPLPAGPWLSAACHSVQALRQAERLGVDFALVSPVARTASHVERTPLGWPGFSALAATAIIPVYALGGMSVEDISRARNAGGQGIAAIRGLWREAR